MQYGCYETIKNGYSLLITKIFFKKARLIRFPAYIRNKKFINFNTGFTCGYQCRLECIPNSNGYGNISFGKNVRIGDFVHISSASNIQIGDNVLIASKVFITDLDHGQYCGKNTDDPKTPPSQRMLIYKDVFIGDNVWIGEGVTVLKGVRIGEGSIIGANTLVTKDVPEYVVYAGNPARIIKYYSFKESEWKTYEWIIRV